MIKLSFYVPDLSFLTLAKIVDTLGGVEYEIEVNVQSTENVDKGFKELETGDRVAYCDNRKYIRDHTECDPLSEFNVEYECPYFVGGHWWRYVRRWEDGAVFGADGKLIDVIKER